MRFTELPTEVILLVFERLNPWDLHALTGTCQRLRELAPDESYWKTFCKRDFSCKDQYDISYQQLYFNCVKNYYKADGEWIIGKNPNIAIYRLKKTSPRRVKLNITTERNNATYKHLLSKLKKSKVKRITVDIGPDVFCLRELKVEARALNEFMLILHNSTGNADTREKIIKLCKDIWPKPTRQLSFMALQIMGTEMSFEDCKDIVDDIWEEKIHLTALYIKSCELTELEIMQLTGILSPKKCTLKCD
ncbi:unnamed protein product [Meganyctiphanes norvegica]|uniref:F-box domain-containing protein n=1 Tax=Meganyctiphanes norvegica TaxID=48144 RepID=A0AAV2PNV2_MEGNR